MKDIFFSSDLIEHYGSIEAAIANSEMFIDLPEDMLEELLADKEALDDYIDMYYMAHIAVFRKTLQVLADVLDLGAGEIILVIDTTRSPVILSTLNDSDYLPSVIEDGVLEYLKRHDTYKVIIDYSYNYSYIDVSVLDSKGVITILFYSIYKTQCLQPDRE
jgi:hypothetical protein